MQITKWRFLVIFWILAIVFLLGEFLFLKWRKESLYSLTLHNHMLTSMGSKVQIIDNICNIDLIDSGNDANGIRVNFFCANGKISSFSLLFESLRKDNFDGFISELTRLTKNKYIFDENKWACKSKEGAIVDLDYKLTKRQIINCNEI